MRTVSYTGHQSDGRLSSPATFNFRDIKPENFLIGRTAKLKENIIHSVDFGLAKPFIDSETGRHVAYAEHRSITGKKVRFAEMRRSVLTTDRNSSLHVRTRSPGN